MSWGVAAYLSQQLWDIGDIVKLSANGKQMPINRTLLAATVFLASAIPAEAEAQASVSCAKRPRLIDGPMVPTSDVARKIYVAIANSLGKKISRTGVIEVLDEGDHWEVFLDDHPPSFTNLGDGREQVIVQSGGGGLEMKIKKCDASVSAHYAR